MSAEHKPEPAERRDFDPHEMALRGRIGAHRLHATHDSREVTAPARIAFLARFEREVDPEGLLPVDERQRRADHARQAYFARLAHLSAKARRQRSTTTTRTANPEPEDLL